MGAYDESIHVRDEIVDGVGPWYWLKEDTGTWGKTGVDGPVVEWGLVRDKILALRKNDRTIIQAGGALGMYPKLWSYHFKSVFTFEPTPISFHILTMNCQKDNIYKFNAALSNDHSPLSVFEAARCNMGMNRVSLDGHQTYQAAALRVDDFNIGDVDAIQLDCEGWELNVLKGAEETIKHCHPVLTVETCDGLVRDYIKSFGGYVERGTCGVDTAFEWVG